MNQIATYEPTIASRSTLSVSTAASKLGGIGSSVGSVSLPIVYPSNGEKQKNLLKDLARKILANNLVHYFLPSAASPSPPTTAVGV